MKKKIILGVICTLILLFGLDTVIGWRTESKEGVVDTIKTEKESSNVDEEVSTGPEEESSNVDEEVSTDPEEASDDDYYSASDDDVDSFKASLSDGFGSVGPLYENGEFFYDFIDRTLEDYGEPMNNEQLSKMNKILNNIYEVVYYDEPMSNLEGIVDSSQLDDKYHPFLNGFMGLVSQKSGYAVKYSSKIGTDTYRVVLTFFTPAGDAIEGYVSDDIDTTFVYNAKKNMISFEMCIQRKPLDVYYEDEQFAVYAYMMETTFDESRIYVKFKNKTDIIFNYDEIPKIVITPVPYDENETSWDRVLSVNNFYAELHKGESYFMVGNTDDIIYDVNAIKVYSQNK